MANLFRRKKDVEACLAEAGPDKTYHAMDTGEVLDEVNSDPLRGLTNEEAECRLDQYGPNVLIEKGRAEAIEDEI